MTHRFDFLDRQYVQVRRTFVRRGGWAALWKRNPTSVSLLPVLALLSRGYHEHGALVRATSIAELAGLDTRSTAGALASLIDAELLEPYSGLEGHNVRFALTDPVVADGVRFQLSGALFSSLEWARLSPGEKCALVCLAGLVPKVTSLADESWCEDAHALAFAGWVNALRISGRASGHPRDPLGEGVGRLPTATVLRNTAMHRTSLRKALARIEYRGLMNIRHVGNEMWVNLAPGRVAPDWDVVCGTKSPEPMSRAL